MKKKMAEMLNTLDSALIFPNSIQFNSILALHIDKTNKVFFFFFFLIFFLLLKWVIKLGWGTSEEHTPSNIRGDLGSNEKIN
jgi:hypothetical protein